MHPDVNVDYRDAGGGIQLATCGGILFVDSLGFRHSLELTRTLQIDKEVPHENTTTNQNILPTTELELTDLTSRCTLQVNAH